MDIPSKISLRSGLLGLGITALSTAFKLGRRSYYQVSKDPPFPTTTTMPKRIYPATKVTGRRYRRRVLSSIRNVSMYRSLRRTNAAATVLATTATTGGYILSPQLSFVPNSDLLAAYRLYRIKKIVFTVYPRVNPANSGLANNFQYQVTCACNPEGPVTIPLSIADISIYDNYVTKPLILGQSMNYTFYPKASNSVATTTGVASSGSYSTNPWLKLDATGITVPHQQLLMYVQAGAAPSPTTINFDGYITIYFDVKV